MKAGLVMRQLVVALLVASVCCCIWLSVNYDDLRNRHADVTGELDETRALLRAAVIQLFSWMRIARCGTAG